MNTLLVGESNPYGNDPAFALWPEPPGSSGARLRAILGLTHGGYLRRFERVNLQTGSAEWDRQGARAAASKLLAGRPRGRFVLLGRRVADAFRVPYLPFAVQYNDEDQGLLTLPHPSGRCRVWNQDGSWTRARQSLMVLELSDGPRQVAGRLRQYVADLEDDASRFSAGRAVDELEALVNIPRWYR